MARGILVRASLVCLLWCHMAGAADTAYWLAPPGETWRGPRWPLVIGVAEPGAEEVALSYLAPLTRDRGALLAITPAGDERRLLDCAQTLAAEQPLDPRATVVVAVGDLGGRGEGREEEQRGRERGAPHFPPPAGSEGSRRSPSSRRRRRRSADRS